VNGTSISSTFMVWSAKAPDSAFYQKIKSEATCIWTKSWLYSVPSSFWP